MSKKVKFPHKEGTREWEKAATNLALTYAPEIIACKHCHAPVVEGFCCTYCGSSDPR